MDWFSNSYWCKISCHEYCTAHCSTLAVFLLRVPTSLQYVLLFCLLYYFFSALGTVVWYLLILYVIFLLRVSSVLNRDSSQFGKKFMFDKNEDTCWNSDQVCVVYIRDFKIQRRDSNKTVAWNANLHKKESSEEKSNFVVACFYSLIVKLGIFTLWSGKNRKEMYKKSVMHVRSCCFAY